MEKWYQIPLLGKIPLDMEFAESCDIGRPVVASQNSELKKYYQDVADKLLIQMGIL